MPAPQIRTDRPRVLVVVFWVVLALTVGLHIGLVVYSGQIPWWSSALFAVNVGALALLWFSVPWRPAHNRREIAATIGFLIAAVLLGTSGISIAHIPLVLIALTVVALALGTGRAAAITVAVLVVMLIGGLILDWPVEQVIADVVMLALLSAFVLAVAEAVRQARRAQRRAEELAERVRDLTLAEERARMAREMHDSLGHQLTVINLGLTNAERLRERDPHSAWEHVTEAKEHTGQVLQDARRWVRALRPLPDGARVDGAALTALAESFRSTGFDVHVEVPADEVELGADAQQVIYRSLQEGLTNAVRHSSATCARARFSLTGETVTLEISDDGDGGHAQGTCGFGLSSLAERADAVGGRLRTWSDDGFHLRVDLPVAKAS